LRIENGVAELGSDYAAQDAFPHDVNFDQTGGVSFRKGCYVGQEVVSRMQHRGTARKRLLVIAAASPLEPGADLVAGGRAAGKLGTPAGNRALAIARLDRVKEANDAGQPLVASGVAVSASLPPGVSYGWPDAATAGED
jgi:folate-binding protein YgfZ